MWELHLIHWIKSEKNNRWWVYFKSPSPPQKKKEKKNNSNNNVPRWSPFWQHQHQHKATLQWGECVGGGGGGEKNEIYRKKQKVVERAKTFATYCMLEILNSSNKDGVNIRICKFVNLPYI